MIPPTWNSDRNIRVVQGHQTICYYPSLIYKEGWCCTYNVASFPGLFPVFSHACMYVEKIGEPGYYMYCHIAGNLAVWQSAGTNTKLKSAKISCSCIYVWRSRSEPP